MPSTISKRRQPCPSVTLAIQTVTGNAKVDTNGADVAVTSECGSSVSRRSVGGGRGDRSSSETQGFFAAKVGLERDGVAPKCDYDVYAVLYLSKTPNNSNRLFFGCPFFKIRPNHCKYFLWLDEHAAKFGMVTYKKDVKEIHDDVDEHFRILNIEDRVSDLEGRIASIKKKGSIKFMLVCVFALSMLIDVYIGSH
ncbi:hypothetical protein PIB30_009338 [Stylosanthes scabra]|uniref:Zinc finger GRF-type domain-containing protein n=1 Tax=Stylosanthes scabra TaxID=79078 RepID=A0ABU6U3X4_9FABA|nr:hypothetical protein [Stylosanthes scabra]